MDSVFGAQVRVAIHPPSCLPSLAQVLPPLIDIIGGLRWLLVALVL
jgi:hypothetical protein